MELLIQGFPNQLEEALEISNCINISIDTPIHNVLVCGLGGSGIGGNLVESMLRNRLHVPITINKTYNIPSWVGKNTLVIFSSYSGNTEETLECFEHSDEKDCQRFIVTSNGKLLSLAKEQSVPHIVIPGGNPPRSALGYSFVQVIKVLELLNLTISGTLTEVKQAAQLLQDNQAQIQIEANQVAKQILGKTPVMYIRDRMESIAIRWRQQINENAKQLCWHHAVPEMNHNELVAWRESRNDLAVIILRNEDDPERIQIRYNINKTVIQEHCSTIIELHSKGDSFTERALYLIHFGDWVSTELAKLRNHNAYEVDIIDYLKGELAKHE